MSSSTFPGTWTGKSGSVTDPLSDFDNADGATPLDGSSGPETNVWFGTIGTLVPGATDDLLFGYFYPFAPTTLQPPEHGGGDRPAGSPVTSGLGGALQSILGPLRDAFNSLVGGGTSQTSQVQVTVPASYTVTGTTALDGVAVASGAGQTVTLAGVLTASGANSATQPAVYVANGAALVTGQLTASTFGLVGDAGVLAVSGIATFAGANVPGVGHVSLILVSDAGNPAQGVVNAGGVLKTNGVWLGSTALSLAVGSVLAGSSGAIAIGTGGGQLTVNGTLTDTDPTSGLRIGTSGGGTGVLIVGSTGKATSVTATIGGSDGSAARAAIRAGGTWTNTGSITLYSAGTLSVAGAFDTATLLAQGTVSVIGGTLDITTGGTLTLDQTGLLNVVGGTLSAPLLHTVSGSNTTINNATLIDSYAAAPVGGAGAQLNGNVDFINATVTETASTAAIVVGYTDLVDTSLPTYVTATNATVVANATTIGAALSSGPKTAELIISGGTWTDSGSGTTMTVGVSSASYLGLSGGARLTDQDAQIGTAIAQTGVAATASVDVSGGSNWSINGSLTVDGRRDANLSVSGGSTVSVGGTLTDDSAGGLSVITVTRASLKVGGNITVGGTGTGFLTLMSGTLTDGSGTLRVSNGDLQISGTGAQAVAASLTLDGGGATALLGAGATLDVTNAGATLGAGSELIMSGGRLLANATTIDAGALISGTGTIGALSTSLVGMLPGGQITAVGGSLELTGIVAGGQINIDPNSTVEVGTSLASTNVQFVGTGGDLEVFDSNPIVGTITGFATGDQIDVGVVADSAHWAGGQLILYAGASEVTRFALSGNYQNAVFAVTPVAGVFSTITITSGSPTPTPGVNAPTVSAPTPRTDVAASVAVAPITDPSANSITATVTAGTGLLAASGGGGASVETEGALLLVSGSVAQVNAALATLTYTATVPGADTIAIDVADDQGGAATQSVTFTVPDPAITLDVQPTLAVVAGAATTLAGVSIADALSDPSLTYTVTISDATGALSATAEGAASLSGTGSATLTVSGDITSIDRTLATLAYTGAVGADAAVSDSLTVVATDGYGGTTTQTIAVAVTQPTAPTETDWTLGDDGDATVGANWSAGVPTAALTTVIPHGDETIAGPITAGQVFVEGDTTFTGPVSAAGTAGDYRTLIVDDGSAAFDADTLSTESVVVGSTAGASGAVSLRDGASATLGGAGGATVDALGAYVGYGTNTTGALSISAASLTSAAGLGVGYFGEGALAITDGGSVSVTDTSETDGYSGIGVGFAAGAAGAITVDGTLSTLYSAGFLEVGVSGTGALSITDGGQVTSDALPSFAAASLGFAAGGEGFASIDGAGSTWTVTQSLVVGYDGSGQLSVTDGATLNVEGTYLRIARDAGSDGIVQLDGAGTTLHAPNTALYVGRDGPAYLSIADGATATVGSAILAQGTDVGAVVVSIDSGGALVVLGTLSDGASPSTTIDVDGGLLATGGGLDIGNGVADTLYVSNGTITGGMTIGTGGLAAFDATSSLGGPVTLAGGTLDYTGYYLDTSTIEPTALAASVIASPGGEDRVTAFEFATLTLASGVMFAPSVQSSLLLDGPVVVGGTVTGFAPGDVLDLRTAAITQYGRESVTASWANGTLDLSTGSIRIGSLDMAGAYAADTFTVTDDGQNGFDITVAAPTALPGPVAGSGSVIVGHGIATNIAAAIGSLVTPGVAGDGYVVLTASTPQYSAGEVTLTGGAVDYLGSGNDTVGYTIINERGQTATGSIAVTVDPGPTVANGTLAPMTGQSIDVTSLIRSLITPGFVGDAETITAVSLVGNGGTLPAADYAGTVSLSAAGEVTYVAPSPVTLDTLGHPYVYQFTGAEDIAFTVGDAYGDTAYGEIGITITAEPGPRAATGAVVVGSAQTVDLSALIAGLVTPGVVGDSETLEAVSAAVGIVSLGAGNVVTYTAPARGSDTIGYTVADQRGDSTTGAVMVTVDPGPQVGGSTVSVTALQTVDLTSLIDGLVTPGLPGDTETLIGVNVARGSASAGTGEIFYAAPASGQDTITYTFVDQYGDAGTGSTTVTVLAPETLPDLGSALSAAAAAAVAQILATLAPAGTTLNVTTVAAGGGAPAAVGGAFNAFAVTDANAATTVTVPAGYQAVYLLSGSGGRITDSVGDALLVSAIAGAALMGGPGDTVIGGDGGDTLGGGAGAETLYGGTGGNLFELGSGADVATSQGSDTIIGGGGSATVNATGSPLYFGGAGAAVFDALGAAATLVGGGAETVGAGAAATLLFGGSGPVTFGAGSAADTVVGLNSPSQSITGGSAPLLYFGSGAETYSPGSAVDTIVGFTGSLTATGGAGGTLFFTGTAGGSDVNTGTGSSTVVAFGAADSITAVGNGNDVVAVTGAAATVNGAPATGSNTFFGFGNNDVLIGGAGSTAIEVATGNDTLVAGTGSTLFVVLATGTARTEMIEGFSPSADFVALDSYGAGAAAAAVPTATFAGSNETITLGDGTQVTFVGVTNVGATSFI